MNPAHALRALRAPMRRAAAPSASVSRAAASRALSTSAPRFAEQAKENENANTDKDKDNKKDDTNKKDDEKKKRASNDDAGPPQSPFKVFLRVFREEIDKNQGWQQNVKQLQGDVDKLADSAAMKKARDAYEKSRVSAAGGGVLGRFFVGGERRLS
jgi:import inner membrane translocase subunit TIM44